MALVKVFSVVLFVFVGHCISQQIRSLEMTIMDGWQLTCASTTCLPFFTVPTPDVRQCRVTCLSLIQCQAATFQWSTSACALFAYTLNVSIDLSLDGNTTTSIVDMGTRIPPGE